MKSKDLYQEITKEQEKGENQKHKNSESFKLKRTKIINLKKNIQSFMTGIETLGNDKNKDYLKV